MIRGHVTDDDVPLIFLNIHGRVWPATIDTGFNGDLELPMVLRDRVNAIFRGRIESELAGGQVIEEDSFRVDFPFDGQAVRANATFVDGSMILVGTRLLREYQLRIGFVSRTVELQRE